jgi:steroid delta-isomerase-like uncharacterized protein
MKGEVWMSMEDNRALLRNYVDEVWTRGNVAALDDFLHADYQRHLTATSVPLTLEGQKHLLAGFREAFPDARLTIEDMLAEGDRVAFRSTMRGTHLGTFQGISPTGTAVTASLLDIIRIQDGRFIEQWGGPNLLDLLQQLGAVVSTPQGETQL